MIPLLSVQSLVKKFGPFTAVNGLTFDVLPNEVFGLLGPNGAGKTTTITLLCGLQSPTSGNLIFDEKDQSDRTGIGYCPQETIFYPKLTCLEQLVFTGRLYHLPARFAAERAAMLLDQLGLTEKTHALASTLSGGMKRRLNIALALVHDPRLLILDEPEAGLDPQSRLLVREFIRQFGKEKTVILTTHNMDEADRLADRILIMDHGKSLLLDTPENLKKTVGEGDLLELIPPESLSADPSNALSCLQTAGFHARVAGGHLIVRHPSLLDHIPAIRAMVTGSGFPVDEMKFRETTLEDVFIHLTGRTLRP